MLEKQKIKGYIPVSASVYKIDEELFSYNKDSDQWFCFMGNYTVSCKKRYAIKVPTDNTNTIHICSKKISAGIVHTEINAGEGTRPR